ncbi:MAG: c-type cytochrome [Pikeienuella sp.]
MIRATIFGVAVVAAVAGYVVLDNRPSSVQPVAGPVVDVDTLNADQARGRMAFNTACADCHGRDALGGDGGPPLIHKIYEPSHHGDGAFYRAVQAGVPQHHWNFGDMPRQTGISRSQVADIIDYVRAAQRQNGIN